MNDKDELKELLRNGFAREYMAYSEQLARRTAADIYAACEAMTAEPKKRKEAVELILDRCRGFLRAAQVSNAFSNALTEPSGPTAFEIDNFVNDFAVRVIAVVGKKADIRVSATSRVIVRTDRELLTYFLLSYIRRYALLCCRSPEISLRTEKTDGAVRLRIAVSGSDMRASDDMDDGFFDKVSRLLDELFVEATGITCSYDEHELVMTIPEAADDAAVYSLRSAASEPLDGPFSPYGVMLGDIH